MFLLDFFMYMRAAKQHYVRIYGNYQSKVRWKKVKGTENARGEPFNRAVVANVRFGGALSA